VPEMTFAWNGVGPAAMEMAAATAASAEPSTYYLKNNSMPICAHALLRAVALLLALSSSMAATADSSAACSSLLKGQNLRRIRRPCIDEGEAVVLPVRPA